MRETTRSILEGIEEYHQSAEGYSDLLRHYLSRLIIDRLEELGWSQRQLAQKIGKRESFISRVVHEDSNCTFKVAGTILHALDLPPAIHDTHKSDHAENPIRFADATIDQGYQYDKSGYQQEPLRLTFTGTSSNDRTHWEAITERQQPATGSAP